MSKAFLAVFASACIVTPFVAGLVRAQNYPAPPGNDWIFYGISTTTQGYEEHWLRITGREGDIVYYEQNHRTPDGEFWGLTEYKADCSRNVFANLALGGEPLPWIGWEKFGSFTERERVIVCPSAISLPHL